MAQDQKPKKAAPANQERSTPKQNKPLLKLDSDGGINANLEMIIRNLTLSGFNNENKNPTNDQENPVAENLNDPAGEEEINLPDIFDMVEDENQSGDIYLPVDQPTPDNDTPKMTTSPKNPHPKPPKNPAIDAFLTCADLFIFELDEKVIEKLIFCAILSMSLERFLKLFKSKVMPIPSPLLEKFDQKFDEKIAQMYNQFLLKIMTDIQMVDNKRDYLENLLESHLHGEEKNNLYQVLLKNLEKILLQGEQTITSFEDINQELEQSVKNTTVNCLMETFTEKFYQFQKSAGQKVICLEEDLTFLSSEILRLTSVEAGILPLANALNVTIASRFAEDDEFKEIFDAVEEVADIIEELADIYRDRLKVLRTLFPFASCPRPTNKIGDEDHIC